MIPYVMVCHKSQVEMASTKQGEEEASQDLLSLSATSTHKTRRIMATNQGWISPCAFHCSGAFLYTISLERTLEPSNFLFALPTLCLINPYPRSNPGKRETRQGHDSP